jgi:2-iminobutanoate/2-iminopropanoate deaminase
VKGNKKEVALKKIIHTEKAPKAVGPYSQAVKITPREMLFCSGQIPIDPATAKIIRGAAAEQALQVMKNVKAVLDAAGFSLEDVVKTTIYLIDLRAFDEVNKVYESFFSGNYPARATVQVAALPKGVDVEIDAIASK